jgi:hypothetical protein
MVNEVLYDSHSRLLNLAQQQDISYKITSKLIQRFSKASQYLLEKYLSAIEEGRISSLEETIGERLIQEGFNSLVLKGEFYEAWKFENEKGIIPKNKLDMDLIPNNYVKELRNKILQDAYALINERGENAFEEINQFFNRIGYDDNLSLEELSIEDDFEFRLHPSLQLDKNDWGKCIIYFNSEDSTFYFNVSEKRGKYIPKEISNKKLESFLTSNFLVENVGYHRNIDSPGQVCGGGAYFKMSDNEIFICEESGDFGRMNKEVIKRCLENSGLNMKTIDDKYFDTRNINEFLLSYSAESKSSREIKSPFPNSEDFIEDDIFF